MTGKHYLVNFVACVPIAFSCSIIICTEFGDCWSVVQSSRQCPDGSQENQSGWWLSGLGTWTVQHSSTPSVHSFTFQQPQGRPTQHHFWHPVRFTVWS